MDKFFHPRSVAVFGVSDKPMNLASGVLFNLMLFNWRGRFYAVGTRECEVSGVPVYSSVLDIDDEIDVAVILAPAQFAPAILRDCAAKGIGRVIIEAGGFNEFDAEGRRLAEETAAVARQHSIRVIGPNCIGTMNAHDNMILHFSPQKRIMGPGPVGLIAQSGGITMWLAHLAWREGKGFSLAAALGNKIDVDETDLLEYYLGQPEVERVLMYLESVGRGREFLEAARRATKPVILFKANTVPEAAKIASSHTAALSNDDAVVEAASRQAALWRAHTAQEMVNALGGLALKPCRGDRLMIVSRSGGHAVMLADAAARHGFDLIEPPRWFRDVMNRLIPVTRIVRQNPLDIGDVFDLRVYRRVVAEALTIEEADAVIFFHTVGTAVEAAGPEMMRPFVELAQGADVPLAVGMLYQGGDIVPLKQELGYPIFETPDDLMEGLAINRDYYRRRERRERPRDFGAVERDVAEAAAILERASGPALPADRALELMSVYGIPLPPHRRTSDARGVAAAARAIGGPCALKVLSAQALHKSDLGGVALHLGSPDQAGRAAAAMERQIRDLLPEIVIDGYLVQAMAPEGVEVIVGARRDATFGPIVLLGMGGVYVEIFRSFSIRVWPVDRTDAMEMIEELAAAPILAGTRGTPACDVGALADIVLRVGAVISDHPQIQEIDVNPVRVHPDGALAVDARVILAA
jgi:acyl-CoA synthetase (NDP forming)